MAKWKSFSISLCKPSLFLDYSKNITLTSLFYYISTIFSSGSQNYTYYLRIINMYFSYKGFLFKEVSFELLFIPSPTKLRRDIVTLPSVRPSYLCEHSRINISQCILTKLGTYLVLKRIWNPIDFQGQRSRSPGKIF